MRDRVTVDGIFFIRTQCIYPVWYSSFDHFFHDRTACLYATSYEPQNRMFCIMQVDAIDIMARRQLSCLPSYCQLLNSMSMASCKSIDCRVQVLKELLSVAKFCYRSSRHLYLYVTNCTRHPYLDVRDTRISMHSALRSWFWPQIRIRVRNNMR